MCVCVFSFQFSPQIERIRLGLGECFNQIFRKMDGDVSRRLMPRGASLTMLARWGSVIWEIAST